MRRSESDETPPIEELLQRHMPSLSSYVRRNIDATLSQRESCADLVQSVCREVLESRGHYRYAGERAFREWLCQVALHKLMDRRRFWRSRKRDAEGAAPGAGLRWTRADLARLRDTIASPSGEASLREELAQLESALDELSGTDREIIRLVHLQGRSHTDAAAVLGCTEAQSRKRLFKALARLSAHLRRIARGTTKL
jgi:RNA polymerase sigma factor (sigma-70 family)